MDIFTPAIIGKLRLPNRIVMAPMARARCNENRAANELVAEYYAQRASAGLLITEASSVSPMSQSRPHGSAIYDAIHVAGWRIVADRVHAAGGRIFQQIYHLGRKSDPSRMPGGATPVAPSAIAAQGHVNGINGPVEFVTPRALEEGEIAGVVAEFRKAAQNAIDAGMDGVEIHGANGYLIDQFLRSGTNRRTDAYGGGVQNRVRFLLEITDAMVAAIGSERVGVRLSPHAYGDGIVDVDPVETFGYAAQELGKRNIACLHVIEATQPGLRQSPSKNSPATLPAIRKAFPGPLIVNGGYDKAGANEALAGGIADLVAIGTPFISNPDLVARYADNAPLNRPDPATFYDGGAQGYVDYPAMSERVGA